MADAATTGDVISTDPFSMGTKPPQSATAAELVDILTEKSQTGLNASRQAAQEFSAVVDLETQKSLDAQGKLLWAEQNPTIAEILALFGNDDTNVAGLKRQIANSGQRIALESNRAQAKQAVAQVEVQSASINLEGVLKKTQIETEGNRSKLTGLQVKGAEREDANAVLADKLIGFTDAQLKQAAQNPMAFGLDDTAQERIEAEDMRRTAASTAASLQQQQLANARLSGATGALQLKAAGIELDEKVMMQAAQTLTTPTQVADLLAEAMKPENGGMAALKTRTGTVLLSSGILQAAQQKMITTRKATTEANANNFTQKNAILGALEQTEGSLKTIMTVNGGALTEEQSAGFKELGRMKNYLQQPGAEASPAMMERATKLGEAAKTAMDAAFKDVPASRQDALKQFSITGKVDISSARKAAPDVFSTPDAVPPNTVVSEAAKFISESVSAQVYGSQKQTFGTKNKDGSMTFGTGMVDQAKAFETIMAPTNGIAHTARAIYNQDEMTRGYSMLFTQLAKEQPTVGWDKMLNTGGVGLSDDFMTKSGNEFKFNSTAFRTRLNEMAMELDKGKPKDGKTTPASIDQMLGDIRTTFMSKDFQLAFQQNVSASSLEEAVAQKFILGNVAVGSAFTRAIQDDLPKIKAEHSAVVNMRRPGDPPDPLKSYGGTPMQGSGMTNDPRVKAIIDNMGSR